MRAALAGGELEAHNTAHTPGAHCRYSRGLGAQPWRSGHQCRAGIVAHAQLVGQALAILHQRDHAEVNMAGCLRPAAGYANLLDDFVRRESLGRCAHAAGKQAGPHVAAMAVLRQPVIEQRVVSLRRLRDRPVKLRREVVDPAVLEPQFGVGI